MRAVGSAETWAAAVAPGGLEEVERCRGLLARTAWEVRGVTADILEELKGFPSGPEPDVGIKESCRRLAAVAHLSDLLVHARTATGVLEAEGADGWGRLLVDVCTSLALCSRAPLAAGMLVRHPKRPMDADTLVHVLGVLLLLLAGEGGWALVGSEGQVMVDVAPADGVVVVTVSDTGFDSPDRERLGGRSLLEAVWAAGGRFGPPPIGRSGSREGACVSVRLPIPAAGYAVAGNA